MGTVFMVFTMFLYIFMGVVIGLGSNLGVFPAIGLLLILRGLFCIYYKIKPFSKTRFNLITLLLWFIIIGVTPKKIKELGNYKIDQWQESR